MTLLEVNPAPPLLVVLSGPSGVGKDAALEELKKLDRPWYFTVTATTRKMREAERDGLDYIFLDDNSFSKMRERDEFLECAEVYGSWYGIPRNQVRNGLKSGKDVILKIDVQGAETVRKLIPEVVTIFMMPSSLEELQARLTRRTTEISSDLDLRLGMAQDELARVSDFDYRVVNRENCLEQAVFDIDAIISAEKCRMKPRMAQVL